MILNSGYSPIALFVYNRPIHTDRTISALLECEELLQSPFYIFCDGPKTPKDMDRVIEARNIARRLMPSHTQLHISETNRGLAASIEQGVTFLCEKYGKAIILEDDLIVGRSFLTYMNAALDKYEASEQVMQVSAYRFPVNSESSVEQCVLLPIATSWGWATWESSWKKYDSSAEGWKQMKSDLKMRKRFNLNGTFDYYSMLKKQMEGKSDSWAVRWYWSVFINKGLVVYPPGSMVENIGFDGSGTHGWRTSKNHFSIQDICEDKQFMFPDSEEYDEIVYSRILAYFRKIRNLPASRLKRLVKKLFC